VRAAALLARGRAARTDIDRALAAHLCRCTGWRTIYDAIEIAASGSVGPLAARDLDAAAQRATLEGGVPQQVGADVVVGHGGFADDTAPRDALVAVALPPGSTAASVSAAGLEWVVGASLAEVRAAAGKVQGRRTTADDRPPLPVPAVPDGGVRLATSWTEPAYLELDASWCAPGGEPATPLANGGAFGGKARSIVTRAARELADARGATVRVLLAREDAVRIGPKRPPIAATARVSGGTVAIEGRRAAATLPDVVLPYAVEVVRAWNDVTLVGPPVGALRAAWAEEHVLVEGALDTAGIDRSAIVRDVRASSVLLDTCAMDADGAIAGARVELDDTGVVSRVVVRVAAGDPLDDVVLRSYATGAVHMALGWVFTESIAVDPNTGDVHDLTIRSFGIVRPRSMPEVDIEVVEDPGPPLPRSSDAVFAAVASAAWNAVARAEGVRPDAFPARDSGAGRALRK
jgi:hypothetical protein